MDIKTNSWLKTCTSYYIDEIDDRRYLIAYLKDSKKNIIKNKIRLHPLLAKYPLENNNGQLKYNLTREDDDYVMNKLFTQYNGDKIDKIQIKECIMLSINKEKYNTLRNETLKILKNYNLPKISIYFGFTEKNVSESKFYDCMIDAKRCQLTCGRLEIFEKFVNESNGNEWLLHFEDDVRPVNIDKNENLNFLYNIPKDAELIRPYIGLNTKCKLKDINYTESYGGVNNHAFYISTNGCKKVINYAKKYGWKSNSDIDLYKISKFYTGTPTGYESWRIKGNPCCDFVNLDSDDEKLIVYHMSNIIFNQTSLPCAPLPPHFQKKKVTLPYEKKEPIINFRKMKKIAIRFMLFLYFIYYIKTLNLLNIYLI